jgi:hypothetical protein
MLPMEATEAASRPGGRLAVGQSSGSLRRAIEALGHFCPYGVGSSRNERKRIRQRTQKPVSGNCTASSVMSKQRSPIHWRKKNCQAEQSKWQNPHPHHDPWHDPATKKFRKEEAKEQADYSLNWKSWDFRQDSAR